MQEVTFREHIIHTVRRYSSALDSATLDAINANLNRIQRDDVLYSKIYMLLSVNPSKVEMQLLATLKEVYKDFYSPTKLRECNHSTFFAMEEDLEPKPQARETFKENAKGEIAMVVKGTATRGKISWK